MWSSFWSHQARHLALVLLEDLAKAADEPSAIEDGIADEAYLPPALDRLASARDSASEALALLRQWLKEADGL
jgi:hypothetical protein